MYALVLLAVGIPTKKVSNTMTRTFKEEQVEKLFDPQTDADKETVILLGSFGRLMDLHGANRATYEATAMLGASIELLNGCGGTFDRELLEHHVNKIAFDALADKPEDNPAPPTGQ